MSGVKKMRRGIKLTVERLVEIYEESQGTINHLRLLSKYLNQPGHNKISPMSAKEWYVTGKLGLEQEKVLEEGAVRLTKADFENRWEALAPEKIAFWEAQADRDRERIEKAAAKMAQVEQKAVVGTVKGKKQRSGWQLFLSEQPARLGLAPGEKRPAKWMQLASIEWKKLGEEGQIEYNMRAMAANEAQAEATVVPTAQDSDIMVEEVEEVGDEDEDEDEEDDTEVNPSEEEPGLNVS